MVITTSVETMDGPWIYCYIGCILGRAPRTKETLPIFVKIWIPINGPQQCDFRSTRNPQEFCMLTGCQRDPQVFGCHINLNEGYHDAKQILLNPMKSSK